MEIPRYDEMFLPLLRHLQDGEIHLKAALITPLADHFGLDEEARTRLYASKNAVVFDDRVAWALSYLSMAGMIERTARAQFRMTAQGRQLLDTDNATVRTRVRQIVAARAKAAKQGSAAGMSDEIGDVSMTADDCPERLHPANTDSSASAVSAASVKHGSLDTPVLDSVSCGDADEHQTPDELIERSCMQIRADICDQILQTLLRKTPATLERIAVMLVQKMGYGGGIQNAGEVTQPSNDGGVDGRIIEDVLGFGRIYVQTKRYKPQNTVGRPELQAFAGALQGLKADKGIFITTSSFTQGARQYADALANLKIVLIDGPRLAACIHDFNLGMQQTRTIVLKEMDDNFWNDLPNS